MSRLSSEMIRVEIVRDVIDRVSFELRGPILFTIYFDAQIIYEIVYL